MPLANIICDATNCSEKGHFQVRCFRVYQRGPSNKNFVTRLHNAAVLKIGINGSCKWYLPRDEQFQAQSLVLLDPPMLENA